MAGSTYTIRWETEGEISDVLIEYSTNNGSDWTAVNPPNAGNTGSYEWDPVPVADSNECLVRISDSTDPAVYDTSDKLFTIFICQGPLVGDISSNCYTDLLDFAILGNQWFQVPGDPSADIAPDGVVDLLDLALLLGNWLECGNPFDPACDVP